MVDATALRNPVHNPINELPALKNTVIIDNPLTTKVTLLLMKAISPLKAVAK